MQNSYHLGRNALYRVILLDFIEIQIDEVCRALLDSFDDVPDLHSVVNSNRVIELYKLVHFRTEVGRHSACL